MSSSQTPRPSIFLKDKNGKRVVREYPPIITQRRSSQFSQQSHQKNQYNNNIIDSISRINANAQQRDRLLNHQVYQSNNHIDRSPAVTNNDSLTNPYRGGRCSLPDCKCVVLHEQHRILFCEEVYQLIDSSTKFFHAPDEIA